MFSPSGSGGRFETRDIPARTYEKTGMQIEIGEQITDIRRALIGLSRIRRDLPRRDLHHKWEYIDDMVWNLFSYTVTLAEPRGVPVRSILRNLPELTRDKKGHVFWEDWYANTLEWMSLILRMLDEAQLLLTEEGPMPDWATPLLGEALGVALGEEDEEDEEDSVTVKQVVAEIARRAA